MTEIISHGMESTMRSKKPKAPNGAAEATQAPDAGAMRQLPQPVPVGEITLSEAREIKALNELQVMLQADAAKASRVVKVAHAHRREFMKGILYSRDLDTSDIYTIDDEAGVISKTHERADVDPAEPGAVPAVDLAALVDA